jgi:hypothetical protein
MCNDKATHFIFCFSTGQTPADALSVSYDVAIGRRVAITTSAHAA